MNSVQELMQVFEQAWALRALGAGVMVGVLCGILGCFIVLRSMSLIGDALSHAVLPGVVLGFVLFGHHPLGFFGGAVLAGLLSAVLITLIQRNVKTKDDAAIGIVFTAMFAIGIIGISALSKKEGVHLDLKDFLFGNVLGVSNTDLELTAMIMGYIVVSIGLFYRYFFISTFQPLIAASMGIPTGVLHYFLMLLLSFAVVASLQSVGVILVVAMLIIPASTALLWSDRLDRVLIISGSLGAISAALGLVGAIIFKTTPGPAMTLVAAFLYLLSVLFAPGKGLIVRQRRKRKRIMRIVGEDILKILEKSGNGLSKEEILKIGSERLGIRAADVHASLRRLSWQGLIEQKGLLYQVTKEGSAQAIQLIRAHRLWETYLVQKLGLKADQIHEQAERLEHDLPEEFLSRLQERLGHPTLDPHGNPIPDSPTQSSHGSHTQ